MIKLLTNKKINKIKALAFSTESFDKFHNISNPDYNLYQDRSFEEWHDKGYNNAIDAVLRIIYD